MYANGCATGWDKDALHGPEQPWVVGWGLAASLCRCRAIVRVTSPGPSWLSRAANDSQTVRFPLTTRVGVPWLGSSTEGGRLDGTGRLHARDLSAGPTPAGWHGPVADFLHLSEAALVDALSDHLHRCMGLGPDGLQFAAWRHEFAVLQTSLADAVARTPRARGWHLVFEYELPRERGRRPDVVVLTSSQVIVLEFKDADAPLPAHVDQVAAYARDLSEYHAASHDKLVDPVLVLTRSRDPGATRGRSRGDLDPTRTVVPDPREQPGSPFDVTITGPP